MRLDFQAGLDFDSTDNIPWRDVIRWSPTTSGTGFVIRPDVLCKGGTMDGFRRMLWVARQPVGCADEEGASIANDALRKLSTSYKLLRQEHPAAVGQRPIADMDVY